MGHPRFGSQEIERRGQEWYDRQIRAELEGKFDGKVVVIDIETGDFEVDDSGLAASHRALDRHPGLRFTDCGSATMSLKDSAASRRSRRRCV